MKYEVLNRPKSGIIFPKIISLDTEYSQKYVRKARLLSISIGVSPSMTYILEDFKAVSRFMEEADIILTWNGVVDMYMIEKHGFKVPKNKFLDAMLMEHLVDENLDHSLGAYALREHNDNYKEEFWSKYSTYQEAPKAEAYEYEMRDGCYTFEAGVKYLESTSGILDLVRHVHKLQRALFDTETKGIKVNKALIFKTKEEMNGKIQTYLPKLREEFKDYVTIWELNKWKQEIEKRKTDKGKSAVRKPDFSFTSDKQISTLLFSDEYMGLPVIEKTKKGSPSTSFETLKELSESHPEISTIVEYKEVKALYATFVEGMLERVEEDNRIYPTFFVNGTTTGRISHANPNLGNLPTTGVIRSFFLPDAGNCIVGADYSQLEVVVEANLTEDTQLLKIINEGASKHDITAQGLGIPRDQAKTLNFALQYGAGVHKITKILGISHSDAQDIYNRYWDLYSGVKALKDRTVKELEKVRSVTNLFGRTRHFPVPQSEYEKAKQQRQAYNFLIQGVGADMTNRATYLIADYLKANSWGRLWFSCHDEIICEVKKEFAEPAKHNIVGLMESINDYLKLKYRVQAKAYGPMECWGKG